MPDAQFVRDHTGNESASGTGPTVATLAAAVPAGNLLELWVAMDNTGTATPTVSSLSKPGGETANWSRIAQHDSSTATSGSGCRGELWVIKPTQQWASGTTIVATLSASPPKAHGTLREFTNVLTTLRNTAGTGTNATGSPTASTTGTTPVIGDLALGAATFESSTNPIADSDTTGGSWSTGLIGSSTGGASAAQLRSIQQYKVLTAASQQTYNPAQSSDSGAAVAILQRDPAVALTVTNVAQAQTADNVALAQVHVLTVQAVAQTQTATSPTIAIQFEKENTFEGLTNGTAVTTGNSGGANGDAFDTVVGTITASTTSPLKGTASAVADVTASGASYTGWTWPSTGGLESFQRVYGKAPSPIPAGETWVLESKGAGQGNGASLTIDSNGTFVLYNATGAVFDVSSTVIAAGQDYRVELRHYASSTGGTAEARLFVGADKDNAYTNPTEILTISGDTSTVITQVRAGAPFAIAATSVKFDSWKAGNKGPIGPEAGAEARDVRPRILGQSFVPIDMSTW